MGSSNWWPAGFGLRVIREHISVFPETDTICGAPAPDPLKVIASDGLLIAVAPDRADSVLTAYEATGIPVVVMVRCVRRTRASRS